MAWSKGPLKLSYYINFYWANGDIIVLLKISTICTKQHYLYLLCTTIYMPHPLIFLLPISCNTFSRSFQNFKLTKLTVKTFIRSLFFFFFNFSLFVIKLCCFIFLFLFDATIILVPRTYVTVYLVFILSGFVWSFWVSNLIWSFNPFFLFVKNFIALMFFLFGLIGFEPRLLIFSLKKKNEKVLNFL